MVRVFTHCNFVMVFPLFKLQFDVVGESGNYSSMYLQPYIII